MKVLVRASAWWVLIYATIHEYSAERHLTPMAHRPECLSHRSTTRDKKNDTAVIDAPVMNKGFRMSAPMSEIYGMLLSCET